MSYACGVCGRATPILHSAVDTRHHARAHHMPLRAHRETEPCAEQAHPHRRHLLTAGGLLSAGLLLPKGAEADDAGYKPEEKKLIAVKYLSSFQRNDQKQAVIDLATGMLKKTLTKEDAQDALRAVLHDAGTYDIKDGSGGLNGSIVQDNELSREENKSLKPYIDKLKPLKAAVDKKNIAEGQGAISWADLLVLAAKVAAVKNWNSFKIAKGVGQEGEVSAAFGADFPVRIGRVDSNSADPAGRVPVASASVEETQKWMSRLNNRDPDGKGLFAPKAPFWEKPTFLLYTAAQKDPAAAEAKLSSASSQYASFKKDYDRSRGTVTRTDYEVDFVTFFTKLTSVGATFNPDMYLKPLAINPIRF